jgi:hypothetical protein
MRSVGSWAIVGACVLLLGCGSGSPLQPVEAEDVSIELQVSGGIAGGGYHLVVDGAARRITWSCDRICPGAPEGEELPVSAELVEELGEAFERAGVFDLDGTDFGTQCCDQFHVEVTYRNDARSSRLSGTESLLPPEMQWPLGLLRQLAYGVVPMIVSPETTDADWPRDAYSLGEVTVEGLTMQVEVSYGGGCGEHRMDLVAWGGWLESSPVQINTLVTHDDGDDPCDAVVSEARAFSLGPLARAYEEAYGAGGEERPTVVLRLRAPDGSVRLVQVRL